MRSCTSAGRTSGHLLRSVTDRDAHKWSAENVGNRSPTLEKIIERHLQLCHRLSCG